MPKRCVTSKSSPADLRCLLLFRCEAPVIGVEGRCGGAEARRQRLANAALAPRSSKWA